MTPLISFTTKEAGYFGRGKVLTWILTTNDILEQAIDPNWKPRLIEKPDVSLKCINAFFFFFFLPSPVCEWQATLWLQCSLP